MLSKVSALHPGNRRQRYPVAHVPDSPYAGYITLTEVIHLDATLIIKLNPNLRKEMDSAWLYSFKCSSIDAAADADRAEAARVCA